jgi:predicted unusual protein kinase regulating ubiquinone biosynthesis (AarF/ABC1/UbiB family)
VNDLPRKAAARTARIAALPLSYAGRSALGFGKRLTGTAPDLVMTEIQQRTAEQLFRTLGELKGGAMKMGQALSIFEAALPDAVAQPYREQLTRLQDSAPPMPTITIREQLTSQLGPEWSEHLTFDPMASAAASIGQVHRGTWRDGDASHDVAVKVQYPGAADAMEADLKQLQRLARTLGPLVPGIDVKALVTELRERTVEELDYEREAESQRRFAEAYRDDPFYVIPDVVARGGSVLVTEWMESPASLAQVIGEGSQEERDHYGLLYARFLFGAPLRTGMLHADPHPGNFRLVTDGLGPLGVLDFGAVARLRNNQLPPVVGTLLRAAADDDYDRLHDELVASGFIRERIRVDVEQLRNYLAPFIEPAQADSFAFSRRWMRRQFRRVSDPGGDAQSTMLRLNLPPEYLLIHRTWTGAIAVLSQLGAEVPFRALLEESVPGFAGPVV